MHDFISLLCSTNKHIRPVDYYCSLDALIYTNEYYEKCSAYCPECPIVNIQLFLEGFI